MFRFLNVAVVEAGSWELIAVCTAVVHTHKSFSTIGGGTIAAPNTENKGDGRRHNSNEYHSDFWQLITSETYLTLVALLLFKGSAWHMPAVAAAAPAPKSSQV